MITGLLCSFDFNLPVLIMLNPFCIALLLAVASVPASAQTIPTASPNAVTQSQYCILVNTGAYYSNSDVRLDYGQNIKNAVVDPQLVQADAAVRKLGTVVAALNYMSSLGWECLGINTLTSRVNQATGGYADAQTGYLLRRAK